jgi:predicted DCC family thiol-disulfide oxidoreductase YuxK
LLIELNAARDQIANVLHNGAVLVIAFQVCVIYATAGLYKVQGSMWQDGSAMGYVLRLRWFQPWPGLDSWLLGHTMVLALVGYVTVFVQIGFPFAVFSPRLKYPSLVVLAGMHLSIAVVLGLPFFSLFMLVGDAVFLSDRVWRAVERRVAGPAYAEGVNALPLRSSVHPPTQSPTRSTASMAVGTPTLVFDGDCAFCSTSVRWAERWCRPAVRFVPWQDLDLAAHGLTEQAVTSAVQWLRPRTDGRPIPSGAAAVARLLLRSRWPFRPLGALLLVPPVSWLGRLGYRLIADNRYRLPGGTPACAVPKHPHADVAARAESVEPPQPAVPAPTAEPTPAAEPADAAVAAPLAEPTVTLDDLFNRD